MRLQTIHGEIDCHESLTNLVQDWFSLWPVGTLPILRQITTKPIKENGVVSFYDAEDIRFSKYDWERPAVAADIIINYDIIDVRLLEKTLHHELAHVALLGLYGFNCTVNPFYGLHSALVNNFFDKYFRGIMGVTWGHLCWDGNVSQQQKDAYWKDMGTIWETMPSPKPVSRAALHHLQEYSAETLAHYITAPELLNTLDPGGFIISRYILRIASEVSERYPVRSVPEPSKSQCRNCLWTITSRCCGVAFRPGSGNCKMYEAR